MPGLLADVDPDGLLEYSVVYTDRALNHMSRRFNQVMADIGGTLKSAYNAPVAIYVPGSGTFGMEAVARQFATQAKVLILRNGWFSYRWSQILDMGGIAAHASVLKARQVGAPELGTNRPFEPAPLQEVLRVIRQERPQVVFAPHVETASGILLPDEYLRAVGEAVREVGGYFVLDCIASGAIWVDMQDALVDVLISAPQKGWSGSPGCAFVMLGDRARTRIDQTTSTSFACDLRRWMQVMEAFEAGGHAYHTTMPTDALAHTRDAMLETRAYGFERLKQEQWALGRSARAMLAELGFASVAAPGYEAPGVVVCYTSDPGLSSGQKTRELGLQTAAGVPLQCDEPADFRSFRIGLFGLDKLHHPQRTVQTLEQALRQIVGR